MYPIQVQISSDILKENFWAVSQRFSNITLAPVIKGNGYGHGLLTAANAFLQGGASILSVFRTEEAFQLRASGITVPLWVLMGPLPEEAPEAAKLSHTTFCLFCREQATALSRAAAATGKRLPVHLAVDTGMGRLGILPGELPEMLSFLQQLPGLQLKGICSHIAKPEEPESPETQWQNRTFLSLLPQLPESCTENHLCASAALLHSEGTGLAFARPGILLYAETILPAEKTPLTQDAISMRSRLISVKELPAGHPISYGCLCNLPRPSRIGVVLAGYDDGIARSLSNRGYALVRGHRVPYLGRVCMSMLMVDLTDLEEPIAPGEEVVLLGKQGKGKITVRELASWADTTPHELLLHIGQLAASP